ncbi:dihydroxyacetone kinase subunit DhaL [Pseudogracilibacillus sp. SO30301A]|uniref:dihydroxyacetone kinase subunit DhaL n=1 Tax=Pseudogracilibacillus sp. SO30301A TaxID=3098291 RepID=UPI00300E1001
MNFDVNDAKEWLKKANEKIADNKQLLTKLDQVIGDGDHGINMARGFNEAAQTVNEKEYDNVSDVFKDIAMTIMSKVGGAAGPLYGTAFLRLSFSLKGKDSIDYKDLVKGLSDGLTGIKQRGRSKVGEKTLVDVWEPVINEMSETIEAQPPQIKDTAKTAMEKTKEIMATKGRAAYFKEKSIGHIDPGSMSSYYLFLALAEVLEGRQS